MLADHPFQPLRVVRLQYRWGQGDLQRCNLDSASQMRDSRSGWPSVLSSHAGAFWGAAHGLPIYPIGRRGAARARRLSAIFIFCHFWTRRYEEDVSSSEEATSSKRASDVRIIISCATIGRSSYVEGIVCRACTSRATHECRISCIYSARVTARARTCRVCCVQCQGQGVRRAPLLLACAWGPTGRGASFFVKVRTTKAVRCDHSSITVTLAVCVHSAPQQNVQPAATTTSYIIYVYIYSINIEIKIKKLILIYLSVSSFFS